MLCHRHLPHQLVYRGSRDREEPEAAAGEQHHHASRLFALRANHHHQVKMVCKNAGTPRGDQRWNRWERGLEGSYEPCAPFLARQERRLEGGLEGGYEPCAPFLTRQERRLEGGLEGGLEGHALKGGKAL